MFSRLMGLSHAQWAAIRTAQHPLRFASKLCRIGCASGFWGDTSVAAPQLIYGEPKIDYLMFDYLSEITMSLLAGAKRKDPKMGHCPDFVEVSIAPYIKDIKRKGIRVLSNAGGLNVAACADQLRAAAVKAGIDDLRIATVTGDQMAAAPKIAKSAPTGAKSAAPTEAKSAPLITANAYLGAAPLRAALDAGADVVIAGRCVDSALALAPLMHEFGWRADQWDLLAAGSLAGHLIECGAQCTGGLFTDYNDVPDWHNIGFPIAECSAEGDVTIRKPRGTGGLVCRGSVAEQLVYEIGDPAAYRLPDVTCDLRHVTLTEDVTKDGSDGGDAERVVRVGGVRGLPPPADYKVSGTYMDGYRLTAVAIIGGGNIREKAELTAAAILKRVSGILQRLGLSPFRRTHVQLLSPRPVTLGGATATVDSDRIGATASIDPGSHYAALWMAAEHTDPRALQVLAREIAPAGTGMAPGLATLVGGRPKVSPILRLHSYNVPKADVDSHVRVQLDSGEPFSVSPSSPTIDPTTTHRPVAAESTPLSDAEEVSATAAGGRTFAGRLADIAWARSGDKGDTANIGVVCRRPPRLTGRSAPADPQWEYLRRRLTAAAVADHLAHLGPAGDGPALAAWKRGVRRYELPGCRALNFLLPDALGGGGIASIRPDPQGKALGQILLDFPLDDIPVTDDE